MYEIRENVMEKGEDLKKMFLVCIINLYLCFIILLQAFTNIHKVINQRGVTHPTSPPIYDVKKKKKNTTFMLSVGLSM